MKSPANERSPRHQSRSKPGPTCEPPPEVGQTAQRSPNATKAKPGPAREPPPEEGQTAQRKPQCNECMNPTFIYHGETSRPKCTADERSPKQPSKRKQGPSAGASVSSPEASSAPSILDPSSRRHSPRRWGCHVLSSPVARQGLRSLA